MTDLDQVLYKDDLLIIETGEYSDLQWNGPVRMLINVSKRDLAEKFLVEGKRHKWRQDDKPDPDDFLPWLIRAGYAEHVDCTSWHVGSYSRFEPN